MGCDIHVMVEARQYPFGPDKWFNVDNWCHDPSPDDKSKPALTVKPIYNNRDYERRSTYETEKEPCIGGLRAAGRAPDCWHRIHVGQGFGPGRARLRGHRRGVLVPHNPGHLLRWQADAPGLDHRHPQTVEGRWRPMKMA